MEVRVLLFVGLAACGSQAAVAPVENRDPRAKAATTPREAIEAVIARWNDDAPLSDHPIRVTFHCDDAARDLGEEDVPPDDLNAMIVQRFGPVTRCTARCCEVVPDPTRPDVVVRALCVDDHLQLDRMLVYITRCRGE